MIKKRKSKKKEIKQVVSIRLHPSDKKKIIEDTGSVQMFVDDCVKRFYAKNYYSY